jgi:type VI secretion system protein ImpC
MSDAQQGLAAQKQTETAEQAQPSLLDQILKEGRFSRDESAKARGRDLVNEFVSQVLAGSLTFNKDAENSIKHCIAQIDLALSKQLNVILHHPDFQKLEASWRGLRYLMNQSETGTMLKIKVLNASKRELMRDFEKATDWDQNALYKKIYEEEYGTFGGDPFGALIGDYEFTKHPDDIDLLKQISGVAAAAHAPFLTAASPDLLSLDSFTELNAPRDLAKKFDTVEYAKWHSFRDSDDSRYVGLCLPRVLMRMPYGAASKPIDAFRYEEGVDGKDHSKYLWGNAAYALGARLTNAFARHGWTAAIRGVENGGLVEGLPTHTFAGVEGETQLKCPTEVIIPDRREKELADLGFIPLMHCKGRDFAAFFSVQSAQKPKKYDKEAANANARLSAQLPYIFAVSRFAHYLKVMMRDKIGSYQSRSDCERELNQWITQYVTPDDNALPSVKASHPLRDARIEVSEVPGKPGAYRAVAFLKPHFQLDELAVSLRLVADLPQSAR